MSNASAIEAGKAYVTLYAEQKPLVEGLQKLAPTVRKQGEALAKIGESTASAFGKGSIEIQNTTGHVTNATIAFEAMAQAGAQVSRAAQAAMVSTAASSKRTAGGVAVLVGKMDEVKPAAKGWASAFGELGKGNVSIESAAFASSNLLTMLKAGGSSCEPLLNGIQGIIGKAKQLEKVKPPKFTSSAFDNSPLSGGGDGAGLPVPESTAKADVMTVKGIAEKLKQTYARVYGLIRSRGIDESSKSGATKLYDGDAVDKLAKAIEDIDSKKTAKKGRPRKADLYLKRMESVHSKIKAASTGSTANMMGLQSLYEGISARVPGILSTMNSGFQQTRVGLGNLKRDVMDFDVGVTSAVKSNTTAMFGLGAAAGAVSGTVQGTLKSLLTMATLGVTVGANVARGAVGIKQTFAPAGGGTAAQNAAANAVWASLVGTKKQRLAAAEMSVQADGAAVGDAFTRGWIPGIAKWAKIRAYRGLLSGVRGVAGAPLAIGSGLVNLVTGQKAVSDETENVGNQAAAAVPKLMAMQQGVDGLKGASVSTSSVLGSLAANAGNIVKGGIGLMSAIAAIAGKGNSHASDRITNVGDSASKNKRSVETTSALDFAANATGTTLKKLDDGMEHFESTIDKASDGNEKAIKKFEELGLSFEQLEGMKVDDRMKAIGMALARIKDPIERDRVAIGLLGDEGNGLVTMLSDLQGYGEKAKAAGAIISPEDVAASRKMTEAMAMLKTVLTTAWNKIGAASIASTTQWITGASKFIEKNQTLIGTFLKIVAGIGAAAGAFVLFSTIGPPVLAVVSALGPVIAALAGPIGIVVALVGGGAFAWARFTDAGRASMLFLGTGWSKFYMFFTGVWSGIIAAVSNGRLGLAGQIAWTGVQIAFFEAIRAMGGNWTSFLTLLYQGQRTFSDAWAMAMFGVVDFGLTAAEQFIDAWSAVWPAMIAGFLAAAQVIGKGINGIIEMIPGLPDSVKMAARGAQAAMIGIGTAGLGAVNESVNKAKAGLPAMKAFSDGMRAKMLAETQATLERNIAALPSDDKRLEGLKTELERLKKEAAVPDATKAPAQFDLPTAGASYKGGSQAGTFSAMAAVGLGGGSVLDKIENHTANAADSLKQIMNKKDKWRMQFSGRLG